MEEACSGAKSTITDDQQLSNESPTAKGEETVQEAQMENCLEDKGECIAASSYQTDKNAGGDVMCSSQDDDTAPEANVDDHLADHSLPTPDFSLMPDVIWVNILTTLSLSDRNHVAQTCKALNAAFNHPTLWYTVKVNLHEFVAYRMEEVNNKGIISAERYLAFAERFSHFFQNLTLTYVGSLRKVPKCHKQVILTLAERCRLESLTLSVSHVSVKSLIRASATDRPVVTDLDSIASIVTNAFRMRSFTLEAWPMYDNFRSYNLLEAVRKNPKLAGLEQLSLFWLRASNTTWASLNVEVPHAEEMALTVSHFNRLTHLKVRSTMLSNEVLRAFAGSQRLPLQNLSILLTYSRQKVAGVIPQLLPSAWKKLVASCPGVNVYVTVVTRIPHQELSDFLKVEIPLYGINFMHYSRCESQDVLSITNKYSKTLQKFADYTDASYGDECLVRLVTECQCLNYLVYHGLIFHTNLLQVINLRGRQWYWLEIFEDNIVTQQANQETDEETVVRRSETGEYYLVSNQVEEESEEERLSKLSMLHQTAREVIGRGWVPVGSSERPGADVDGDNGQRESCTVA